MELDLDKVQVAMDWLAETPGGDQALKALADASEALRAKLPNELNNAEIRYVLERLMQQRSLDGWDKKLELADVAGFTNQPIGALFPQQTGLTRAQLPSELLGSVRILNYGFIIKASIPPGSFGLIR
ncbi:MAG: hypothetical protein HYX51_08870 [Chloroflexi bacterium]|nr:hypothetical protein [Chloroflexota bacterium]